MRESLSFAKVCTHFTQRHRRRTQRALTVALFFLALLHSLDSFLPSSGATCTQSRASSHAVRFFNFFYREFYSSHLATALSAAALSSSKNLLFVLG